ncbi:GDSL-type esterase/lipase family protein [Streptomyces sp. NPDC021012]|uniref:SGNH/GDSL hydrolase family protein n=1 Tax=Streptomyces sp. NPDC021012 TaxID=3365107 RepID=UPI00378E9F56
MALGDSYSAGGGSSTTYLNDCNQSVNSYPYLYARLTTPDTFAFLACGAAKTTDVLANQLSPLDSTTTLVSMTIGGNDIGLGTVMATCLFGSDSACLDAVATAETTARTELPGKLDTVYDAVRARAPQARVVILGYPRFYDLTVPACPGISATKRTALNKGADALNNVIRDEVAQHSGFVHEDVADRFTSHQLCDAAPLAPCPQLAHRTVLPPQRGRPVGGLPARPPGRRLIRASVCAPWRAAARPTEPLVTTPRCTQHRPVSPSRGEDRVGRHRPVPVQASHMGAASPRPRSLSLVPCSSIRRACPSAADAPPGQWHAPRPARSPRPGPHGLGYRNRRAPKAGPRPDSEYACTPCPAHGGSRAATAPNGDQWPGAVDRFAFLGRVGAWPRG